MRQILYARFLSKLTSSATCASAASAHSDRAAKAGSCCTRCGAAADPARSTIYSACATVGGKLGRIIRTVGAVVFHILPVALFIPLIDLVDLIDRFII